MATSEGRSKAVLRFFIAHGLAYPIAIAWAFGSVPAFIIGIASRVGTSLEDADIAHRVLLAVAWPTGAAFLLAHVAGVLWGFAGDEARAKRRFFTGMAVLGGVPVVLGSASWIWLVTR
ncbi:MAG TPA: hypothetical protein VIY73_04460 [Polyangiaceae bacterium]